jgi:nitrogen fixation/metabolism regulation signal transduction histidine kinase
MKLAVQHLVVAHKDKSEKFNSIFEKVTNTIITQIDILKNIASEFSSFAKMPSLKIENTNIVEIINATINLFIDEECTIKLNSKNSQLFVNTDKEQFQRMIVNLIRNSIQAKSNNISIELIESDKTIELLVIDDGTGIPADVLPKIFDDNFTTKKEGMGLGLALSKRLVEQTNGNISVVSTSVKGTIIKVELVNINV